MPIGTFLSGGLDSSVISSVAAGWLPESALRREKGPYPKTVRDIYLETVVRRLRRLL